MSKTLEKKTLREWRDAAGLTQSELGELAGVSGSLIREMESGKASHLTPMGRQIAKALGVEPDQILRRFVTRESPPQVWTEDGYAEDAPRQTLKWWRERRAVSQADLVRMAGVTPKTIFRIENETNDTPPRHATRRKLAEALRVAPHKLILPGDPPTPTSERSIETLLRYELRGARRALRKSYDFLREDPNIAFKAMENRDALLKDVEREIRGL